MKEYEKEYGQFDRKKYSTDLSSETNIKNCSNMDRILDRKLILLVLNKDSNEWELPKYEWAKSHASLRTVKYAKKYV